MKKLFFIIILFIHVSAFARHIAGGELFYTYLGPGSANNTSKYKLTLRLFRDCASTGPQLVSEDVYVGAYENYVLKAMAHLTLDLPGVQTISLNTASFPCLVGTVSVCYQMATYSNEIELPINATGYMLNRTSCCRIDGINNLGLRSSSLGATYVTSIPGTNVLPNGFNNSPQFLVKDTALVCANRKFQLDFGAVDPDNDSLSYSFCTGYNGISVTGAPSSPYLTELNYSAPYTGTSPLGSSVIINSYNGMISGIAPPEGSYVVNVCITEWRNGKAINVHRKDFILKVQSCDIIEADLPDKIINCDSFAVQFVNQSTSSGITEYLWTFGDPRNPVDSSYASTPVFTYSDTGSYKATLTVKGPRGCVGSDSTTVLIYPGFSAAFSYVGSCYKTPFSFTDKSTTKYGVINSWLWNFGDTATTKDTSTLKNPSYLYSNPSSTPDIVSLIVTSDKGCIDTAYQQVRVTTLPTVSLPFKDTLICILDSLPLLVKASGSVSWSPNYNLINPSSLSPIAYPKDTTTYFVTVNENGCIATDSVKVNVLQYITVNAGPDTTICKTDTFRLDPVSYGLKYTWTASTGTPVNNVKYPLVQPMVNTTYFITVNLGKCAASDTINVAVVPYPFASAGADTTVCFGASVQLQGSITGSSFDWQPKNTLLNPQTLTPVAGPSATTAYILTVTDTLGCPKPVSDTIYVYVVPQLKVSAGNDTSVVADEPLPLFAVTNSDSAMASFTWTPPLGLNDPSIYNPVATLSKETDSVKYHVIVVDNHGCSAENDVTIVVYKSTPEIYVPSAFTPNNDGRNDILKPITVGIVRLEYFKIFNRWGQLLYSTSEIGKGWDGYYGSSQQPSGTYVYVTQGVDYTGKTIFRKGTTVLIR